MANFVLVYHGGSMPDSPEEGARVMAAWTAWFGGLGDKLVDMGNPCEVKKSIGADGSVRDDSGSMSGYSIIKADSDDEAVAIARGCPVLQGGSTIQIAETFDAM